MLGVYEIHRQTLVLISRYYAIKGRLCCCRRINHFFRRRFFCTCAMYIYKFEIVKLNRYCYVNSTSRREVEYIIISESEIWLLQARVSEGITEINKFRYTQRRRESFTLPYSVTRSIFKNTIPRESSDLHYGRAVTRD